MEKANDEVRPLGGFSQLRWQSERREPLTITQAGIQLGDTTEMNRDVWRNISMQNSLDNFARIAMSSPISDWSLERSSLSLFTSFMISLTSRARTLL